MDSDEREVAAVIAEYERRERKPRFEVVDFVGMFYVRQIVDDIVLCDCTREENARKICAALNSTKEKK